ncbi:MAG: hypothetical protein PHV13_00730 [Candidatus ainarchaeum sp.]|nr:hypothetical protein [Candidatus ainarchaeum sp.]
MGWLVPAALKYFLPQIITGEWVGERTYIGPERRKYGNLRRQIDEVAPYLKKMARLLSPDTLRDVDENLGRQRRAVEKAEGSGGRLSPEAVIRGYSNLSAMRLPGAISERRLDTCPGIDVGALQKLKSKGIETVGEFFGAGSGDLHVLDQGGFNNVNGAIANLFIPAR